MASGSNGESTAEAQSDGEGKEARRDGEGADDDGQSGESGSDQASLASAIEDVSSLPGETVNDQDGRKIGEVKEIYAVGDDETPMWVTIESATGLGRTRQVFVPLARIKKQHDEIRVPYTYAHIHESPEVEPGDELSEEDERALRVYYAIGLADQELVENAQSYASQVPDEDEAARKVGADAAEGPVREIDDTPPAERAAEAYEKQKEQEGEEHRKGRDATADDVFEEDGGGDDKDDESKEEKKDEDPEGKEKPGGEEKPDEGKEERD
jgi:hypothetical protein